MSVRAPLRELSPFSARWSVQFSEVTRELDTFGARADAEQSESVRRIEALFIAAKTAIGALRTAEADNALTEAESLIRNHAELPQSAWLLAELYATRRERIESEDPASSRDLAVRAALLEGERASAFRDAALAELSLELPAAHALQIRGTGPRDRVEWNGEPVTLRFEQRPGEHHVRVLRRGRLVWAGWVSVGAAATVVDLPVPAVLACSADDLGGALDGDPAPLPDAATQCSDWAAARSRNGVLELARCHRARCGNWEGQSSRPATQPAPARPQASGLPRWFTYAAIGAGTALVAGFVLASSGAFGASDPTRERWVYSGFR